MDWSRIEWLSDTPKPEALLAGLGDDWVCNDLTIKAYPCHVTGQAIAHAIVNHLRGNSIDADEIKSVKIGATARLASPRHGDRSPQTDRPRRRGGYATWDAAGGRPPLTHCPGKEVVSSGAVVVAYQFALGLNSLDPLVRASSRW